MTRSPTRNLKLNDGNQIPWLGYGTGTAFKRGQSPKEVLSVAFNNGVHHLDGAQMYGNEAILGAGIAASGIPRSELFVTTKFDKLAPGQTIKQSLQESLKKLGLDYVDLFLIHCPQPLNREPSKLQDVWRQFEGVKKEGLTKSIGVSNFRVEDLRVLLKTAEVVPAVNQIELHPYVWKAAEPIVKFCQEHGIAVASYSGLTPITQAAGGPLDAVLPGIRARLEQSSGTPVTTGQVLTKWLIQKGVVVITTSTKDSRIKEFVDAADLPDLTAEEVIAIEREGAKLHKRIYMRTVFEDSFAFQYSQGPKTLYHILA